MAPCKVLEHDLIVLFRYGNSCSLRLLMLDSCFVAPIADVFEENRLILLITYFGDSFEEMEVVDHSQLNLG